MGCAPSVSGRCARPEVKLPPRGPPAEGRVDHILTPVSELCTFAITCDISHTDTSRTNSAITPCSRPSLGAHADCGLRQEQVSGGLVDIFMAELAAEERAEIPVPQLAVEPAPQDAPRVDRHTSRGNQSIMLMGTTSSACGCSPWGLRGDCTDFGSPPITPLRSFDCPKRDSERRTAHVYSTHMSDGHRCASCTSSVTSWGVGGGLLAVGAQLFEPPPLHAGDSPMHRGAPRRNASRPSEIDNARPHRLVPGHALTIVYSKSALQDDGSDNSKSYD